MKPFSRPSSPVPLDPVAAAIIEQLNQQHAETIAEKDARLERMQRELKLFELKLKCVEERLRLELIKKYGKRSEKLSDLQLHLLDLEPAVSSDEVETEAASGPLPEDAVSTQEGNQPTAKQQNARRNHPGRNPLPAHLERVEKIIACAPEQCVCGKCGAEKKVIGYETTEVLEIRPIEYVVSVVKVEKRACKACPAQGVSTAMAPARIAPRSIFSDETIVEFIIRKYCDALPLYRQRAILRRDLGIDVALTTINDAVLRAGELLIPIVDAMKRDLMTGGYIQADETHVGVQTAEKKGSNHKAWFWQYSAPGKGVVFDFEMTRAREVPKAFFKDYGGILHTDGYCVYDKDIGTAEMIHANCIAHARRKVVDAIKARAKVSDPRLERAVALFDALFAIDREAREQKLSLDDRHALRQERAPVLLAELKTLLQTIRNEYLPNTLSYDAAGYMLNRWEEMTRFMKHPVIELSTNWAENSMRPIAVGRKNWLHLGSKEAGPKIAAIFSIVESCRKLGIPIRKYLIDVLPGLADRSIQSLAELTPAAYAAKMAK